MDVQIHFTQAPIVIPPPRAGLREIGACIEFQGIVRETENGAALQGLDYEAYEPMARRTLEVHLGELQRKHPCDAVHFIHRLGWVPVGEASLYIRVLSSHRAEAIALLSELIDRLKQDVPIWKRNPSPIG